MKEITNSAISLLKKLIRTESFSSNEEKTSLLIQNWFKQHNINFKTYKNNVYAYNMFFDENKPTILLNSHHDTVMPNSGYTNDPVSYTHLRAHETPEPSGWRGVR